jgi:hypothetical protein
VPSKDGHEGSPIPRNGAFRHTNTLNTELAWDRLGHGPTKAVSEAPAIVCNHVLDPKTGEKQEYCHLIKQPESIDTWNRSFANELGRLAQGIRDQQGTNTILFIPYVDVPKDRTVTYGHIVVNICPHKDEVERTRLTIGGNLIDYPGDVSGAMDMRSYWIQDRIDQGHFHIFWALAGSNLGDFYTKHHPIHHYCEPISYCSLFFVLKSRFVSPLSPLWVPCSNHGLSHYTSPWSYYGITRL